MKKAEDKAGSQICLILNHYLHGVLSGSPSGTSWAQGTWCCRGVGGRLCSYCASWDPRLPSRVCGSQPGPPPPCGCGVHGSQPGPPADMGCTGLCQALPLSHRCGMHGSQPGPLHLQIWGVQVSAEPPIPSVGVECTSLSWAPPPPADVGCTDLGRAPRPRPCREVWGADLGNYPETSLLAISGHDIEWEPEPWGL